MLLFINGYTLGCKPFKPYWSSSDKDPDEFIHAAAAFFNDSKIVPESFINGSGDWFGSMAWSRQASGRNFAKKNVLKYKALLEDGETIKIVSHSMGAAFTEGLVSVFVENNIPIEKIIHFAPSDASSIKIDPKTKKIERIQINTSGDIVIEKIVNRYTKKDGFRIPGINKYGKVHWDPWKYHAKHMSYLKEKKLPLNWDSHFDSKTYAFAFDWVKDLEETHLSEPLSAISEGETFRFMYAVDYSETTGTRFQSLFLNNKYIQYIEPLEQGKSDKFKGPVQTKK